MKQIKRRKSYSKEYKLDVIQQSNICENIKEIAEELGLLAELIYRRQTRPPLLCALENQKLKNQMPGIWSDSKKKYGSSRIHHQLFRQGCKNSRPRVDRLIHY